MSGGSWTGAANITSSDDLVDLRARIRAFADSQGFDLADVTRIVTASSELMRNITEYAGEGEVRWRVLEESERRGLELTFEDEGPGIERIDRAMASGVGTGRGLGMGLPGAERLMDELEIDSEIDRGTRVVIRKWLPPDV